MVLCGNALDCGFYQQPERFAFFLRRRSSLIWAVAGAPASPSDSAASSVEPRRRTANTARASTELSTAVSALIAHPTGCQAWRRSF